MSNTETVGPKQNIESSIKNKGGGHGYVEKRGDVQESLDDKLQRLFNLLPEHSKLVLAREIRQSGEGPEQAIKRIEIEITIRESMVDHLKHSGDPQAALEELRRIITEEKIQ